MADKISRQKTDRIADMLENAENTPDGYMTTQTDVNEAVQKLAQTMIAADSQESGLDIAAQGSPDDAMATLMQRLDALGEGFSAGSEYLDALKQLIRDEGLSFARQTRATPFYARLAIINGSPDDLPACQHYHYMIIDGEGAFSRDTETINAPQLTIFGTQSTQSRLPVLGPLQAQKGKKALLIYFASMNAEDEAKPGIATSHTAEDNPVIDSATVPDADTVPNASTAPAYDEAEAPAYDTPDGISIKNEEAPEAGLSQSVTGEIADIAHDDNTANDGPDNAHPDIVSADKEVPDDSYEHGDRQRQADIAADPNREDQHFPDQEDLTPYRHSDTSLEAQNTGSGNRDPDGKDAQFWTAEDSFANEAANISHAALGDDPQMGEDETQLGMARSATAETNLVSEDEPGPRYAEHAADKTIYAQDAISSVGAESAPYKPQATTQQNISAATATTKPDVQQVSVSPKTQVAPQSQASTATGNAALATAVTVNAGDTQMRLNATFDQHSRAVPEEQKPSNSTQTGTVSVFPANDHASAKPATEKGDAPQSENGSDEKRQGAESKVPGTRHVTNGQPEYGSETAKTNGKDNGARDIVSENKGQAVDDNKATTTPAQQASDHEQAPSGNGPHKPDDSPPPHHGPPQSPEEEMRGHPPGCGCKLCSGEAAGSEAEQTQDADNLFDIKPEPPNYTPMANDAGASGPETDTARHPPGCGCKLCAGETSGTESVHSTDPFADLTLNDMVSKERHKRHHPEPV